MKTNPNAELKAMAKAKGVFLYEVADNMGISEATIMKHLRRPLPNNERTAFINAVNEIAKTKGA